MPPRPACASVALRYFNVAGASDANGEDHDPETHLIPNLLRAVETGEPVTLFGDDYPTPDGTAVRDYVHVLDLADAHLAALELTASMPAGLRGRQPRLGLGLQRAPGGRGRRSWWSVPRCHRSSDLGAKAIRRSSSPATIGRSALLGWTPARGTLAEMVGSAWAWRQARRTESA